MASKNLERRFYLQKTDNKQGLFFKIADGIKLENGNCLVNWRKINLDEKTVFVGKHKNTDISTLDEKLRKQIEKGILVEMEHTNDKKIATEIAKDHVLGEKEDYYDRLEIMEKDNFWELLKNDKVKKMKLDDMNIVFYKSINEVEYLHTSDESIKIVWIDSILGVE